MNITNILDTDPCSEARELIQDAKTDNLYQLWRTCHRGDCLDRPRLHVPYTRDRPAQAGGR